MSHEVADEVYIAAKAIQLGHGHGHGHVTPELPSCGQRGLELRAAVQGVRALAGLNLNELAGNGEPFSPSELAKRLTLGLNAQS